MIHPTAIIHPKAELDSTVAVGPYAVIDEHVTMGAGCRVGPHAYITGHTTIGQNNRFYAGCVVGEEPQDVKYNNQPTETRIGDNNLVREGATIHRSAKMGEATVVGSNNFLMANSHIGHNVILGNHIIVANGALLAGHAQIADRVFISGNCLVHQFCRLGTLSLMQGGTAVSQDLPPYTILGQVNGICGLNVVGLRRNGFTAAERDELKKLYHALFRSGQNLSTVLPWAKVEFTSAPSQSLLEFIAASKRGVCQDVSTFRSLHAKFDEGDID